LFPFWFECGLRAKMQAVSARRKQKSGFRPD
jgi:hypothetical protein